MTGGFAVEPMTVAIHRVLDVWAGTGRPAAITRPERRQGAAIAVTEARPSLELRLGWLGGPPDDDHAARQILVEMIDRLSPRVRCSYVGHRAGGHYEIRGELEPGVAAVEIVNLRDAIDRLGDGSDASKQLFSVARRAVAMKAAAGPISSFEWSTALVHTVELGRDLAWRQQLAPQIANAKYDDVKTVITRDLNPSNATWMLVGPADATTEVFARLGLTPEKR